MRRLDASIHPRLCAWPNFATDCIRNLADGWDDQVQPREHDRRSKVRAPDSMDTTISDLPKFVAALVRGDGLSAASRAEMTKPQLHITTAHQFPLFLPDLAESAQGKDLYAGIDGLTLLRNWREAGLAMSPMFRPSHSHQDQRRGLLTAECLPLNSRKSVDQPSRRTR